MPDYKKHDVPPGYLNKWQGILDRVAATIPVPAALVMRVWPEQIEVLLSSLSDGNPYEEHEKADLGTGLYCEAVMASRAPLFVANALDDPLWQDNPDVKLNMINYYGVPLVWPDESIFGTLCVLDGKTHHYGQIYRDVLWQVKTLIEADFAAIKAQGIDVLGDARIQAMEHDIDTMLDTLRQQSA